jgi:biopolymer transport protein ExbD
MFVTACGRKSPEQIGFSHLGPPVMLPKHVTNAEVEPAAEKESAVTVTLPGTQQFYVGGEQYPQELVGEKVSPLLARETEPNRIVYIRGSLSLDYRDVANVIDSLRKVGVTRIGLLVETPAGARGPSLLRVQIPPEPNVNDDLSKLKPNPLTLVVSITKDLKLKLNQGPMGAVEDSAQLTQKLSEILQNRKEQHAYKPGLETRTDLPEDERVEKTVIVKAQRSTRYGDVVRLIGVIKGTGANPIVLQIDDLSD